MDTKTQPGVADRVYVDFEPFYEWARDERQITVLLAEYRRDQMKVQVTSKPALKVMGERLVAGNRWHRFDLELPLPSDYDTDNVLAKFEGGKLSVKFGKLDKPRETTPSQPEEVPRPSDQPQKVDQQKNDQADTPEAKEDKAEEKTNKELSDQKTPQKEFDKLDKPRETTPPQPEEVPRPSDQPQKVDQQKNDQADTPKAKEDKAEEKTNKEVSDQKTPQKEPMNETENSKIETDNKDKVDQEAKTKGLTETKEAATSKAPETRVAKPVTRSKTKLIDFTRSSTPNKFDKKVVRDSKAAIKKWKKWVIWMVLILLVVGLGFYARKAIRSTLEEFNFQELEFTPEDYFLEL